MKIEFATTFDSDVYPGLVNDKILATSGVLRLGPIGLLTFLELHLGLKGKNELVLVRAEQYRKALKEVAKKSKPFYKASFLVNDYSVAKALLTWRDELKLSGWNFQADDSTPARLADLAFVERLADLSPGFSERFQEVLKKLKEGTKVPVTDIVCHEPSDLLPSFYAHLFQVMAENGVKIHETSFKTSFSISDLGRFQESLFDRVNGKANNKIDVKGDGSLVILKFKDDVFAANYFSRILKSNPGYKPLVVLENGDYVLGDLIRKNGIPSFGWSADISDNPVVQLFKMIPVLLWEPIDPHRLLELLTLPDSPLPKYLSNKLAEVVASNPGINSEAWKETIEEKFTKNSKYEGEYKKQVEETLSLWFDRTRYNDNDSEGAPKDEVTKLYTNLRSWATRKSKMPEQDGIYALLADRCSELMKMLEYGEATISKLKLELLIKSVGYSSFQTLQQPEAGSLPIISQPSNLVAEVDDVLWWNFSDSWSPLFKDTWTKDEINYLQTAGVHLDLAEKCSALWSWQLLKPMRNIRKRLLLVIPEKMSGVESVPHPLLSNLEAIINNLQDVIHIIKSPDDLTPGLAGLKKTEIKHTALPASEPYWQLKNHKLIKEREKESFSGLSRLFFYPYLWVLNYQAKISPSPLLSVSDGNLILGTLGHRVIEMLFCSPDILKLTKQQIEKKIDSVLADLLPKEGSVLLMKGSETLVSSFRQIMKRSINDLLRHIRENGWTISEMESSLSGKICETPLESRIDLILKRGKEVAVVDLKWGGAKYRTNEIINREELQLIVYAKQAGNGSFSHTAYYILNDAIMIARNKHAFKDAMEVGDEEDHIAVSNSIWMKMENTYKYRLEEVKKGKIEVGEGIETELLDIFSAGDHLLLMPQEKDVKKASSFNDYSSLIELI